MGSYCGPVVVQLDQVVVQFGQVVVQLGSNWVPVGVQLGSYESGKGIVKVKVWVFCDYFKPSRRLGG